MKEKPGPEVFFKTLGHPLEDKNSLYQIILRAVRRLEYLKTGDMVEFDPLAKGLSFETAATYVFRRLKEVLPAGFDYNIDLGHRGYGVTLYRVCDLEPSWIALEVGIALKGLEKTSKPLFGLFLSFLRQFNSVCSIPLWDEGLMCTSLDSLKDNVLSDPEAYGEDVESVKRTIAFYQKGGEGARYARLIRNAKKLTADELRRHARRFKKGNQIADVIFQGAEIIKPGFSMQDYYYPEHYHDMEYSGMLDLMEQAAILFESEDDLVRECESFLDCDAQEGIMEPFVTLRISEATTKQDFDNLEPKIKWPSQLQEFVWNAQDLIGKFLFRKYPGK